MLVGRDRQIDDAGVALARLKSARSAQHLLVHGLRGTGKTVLLWTLGAQAERHGYRVIRIEAVGDDDAIVSLLRQAQRLLDELDRTPLVSRALRSIDSVTLTVAGSGIRFDRAAARPDREVLADVVVDLAAAASEQELGVVLSVDEAQLLDRHDLRRVLAGVHRCGQEGLALWCVVAGLPNVVGHLAKAATYAERMFTATELGPFSPDQVARAVAEPAADIGVRWADAATEKVVDASDGYPFFVQVWAFHTWNVALDDPISATDVERAAPLVGQSLDGAFFAARIARIAPSEIDYVRALASLGPGPHRSGEVATAYGRTTPEVGAFRDRLIREGLVYAPRFGWVEFAIPHFDDYVRRSLPPL